MSVCICASGVSNCNALLRFGLVHAIECFTDLHLTSDMSLEVTRLPPRGRGGCAEAQLFQPVFELARSPNLDASEEVHTNEWNKKKT